MFGLNAILAHQGGWDEVLLVAAPIVAFVLLLRFANQRATKLSDAAPPPSDLDPNPIDGARAPERNHDSGLDDGAQAED